MADLTHAQLFRYFAEDPETSVITAFVEGVPEVPVFLDTIAQVSRKKPIVILKGRRSKSGQRAALSHTGSLAGDGRVWESLLREAGATFVETSEELFDVAAAFARSGSNLPRGNRAAIFSRAGGPGVVAADHCEQRGIELPQLEEQLQSLRPIVPPFAALGNPVEVTGQTKREHLHTCAQAIVTQPNVDALIGIAIGLDFPEFARSIIVARDTKPAVTCVVAPNSETMFVESSVPNYPSVDRAVRALRHLTDRRAALAQGARAVPGTASAHALRSGVHSEAESKAYLSSYAMPVTREQVVNGVDAAVAAMAGLTRTATRAAPGTNSRRSSNRFADTSVVKILFPVRLPPGRARLATRPSLTGSSGLTKTMGIVVVAALAANAEPPVAAITATWRRTNSAASAGSRSI